MISIFIQSLSHANHLESNNCDIFGPMDKQMLLEIIERAEAMLWERDRHDTQQFLIEFGRLIQAAKSYENPAVPKSPSQLLDVIKQSRSRQFSTRH